MNTVENLTAMVRFLIEYDNSTKSFKFKEFEFFPLAFTKTEDFRLENYAQIEGILKSNDLKIYKMMIIKESGTYEFVGKFKSKNLVDQDGKWVENVSWEIENNTYYQLTEQELEKLSG